jgi:P-type Na+/K+ transporter
VWAFPEISRNNAHHFHILSANIAEVILLVLGLAFKDPTGTSVFPMSPVQILWLNMATSSPPAMGLGFEKAANHLQHVPPRPKNKGMFGRELTADMFFFGTLMGILSLANWVIVIFGFGDGRLGNAESHGLCNKAPYDLIQPGGPCEVCTNF